MRFAVRTCGRERLAAAGTLASLLTAVSACAFEPPRSVQDPAVRAIVRFAGGRDPSDAVFRARVARDAKLAGLELIRPMSGDAFVMRVSCGDATAATPDPCAAALARLRAAEDVVDVEIDVREKPLR